MNSRQRDKRQSWMLVALIALLVGSFVYTGFADHNRAADQQSQLQCITDYTSANYARQSFLAKYATPRNDAQVAYEIAKANGAPLARIERLRVRFIAAARAYNAASKANPLPPPPQLACGLPAPVTTPSVGPVHAHSSQPGGPGAPGPASVSARPTTSVRTRSTPRPTRSATVTRTRQAPPPKTHTVTRPAPNPSTSSRPRPNPIRSLICLLPICPSP